MSLDPISLTGWATLAMAVVTFILAIAAFASICYTNKQNKTVNKHNEQTLELMRKTYEPTLSLDLSRDRLGRPRNYAIIIRNDGNGPAKDVELWYRFYIQQMDPAEDWRESENDLEPHGPVLRLGNLGPGTKLHRSTGRVEENKYAIYLEARYKDIFGLDYKSIVEKIYLDDVEDFDISS